MKEIPSTRGLFDSFHRIDKAPKNKTRSITAEQLAAAEARIKKQTTLLPTLSHRGHKSDNISSPGQPKA